MQAKQLNRSTKTNTRKTFKEIRYVEEAHLNYQRRNAQEALPLHPIQKLPPRPVGPCRNLQKFFCSEIHESLSKDCTFSIAIHFKLLTSFRTDSQPPRQWVVVHKSSRKGGFQGLQAYSFFVEMKILDGESQEFLVIKVRQIEKVFGCWRFWIYVDGLSWIDAVWEFRALVHDFLAPKRKKKR